VLRAWARDAQDEKPEDYGGVRVERGTGRLVSSRGRQSRIYAVGFATRGSLFYSSSLYPATRNAKVVAADLRESWRKDSEAVGSRTARAVPASRSELRPVHRTMEVVHMSSWYQVPTLQGKFVLLRGLEENDAPALAAAHDGHGILKYFPYGPDSQPPTPELVASTVRNPARRALVQIDRATGTVVGTTSIYLVDEVN
jgi:hypothetical protein